ncbi:MAG: hypothetical protein R3C60_04115 [Parvularculaceae bacterium]
MRGQFFKFGAKGLEPPPIEPGDRSFLFQIIWAHIPWAWNRLRVDSKIIACAAFGLVLFLTIFFVSVAVLNQQFCALFDFINSNIEKCSTKDADIACKCAVAPTFADIKDNFLGEMNWALLIGGYFVARAGQHILDWREWHTTWAHTHGDRANGFWRKKVGAQDYPCLILGRGGSGKSTLAEIMEHDYLRRQIFRPSGFKDEGGDENLVARTEGAVGGDVRRYNVTWRPGLYKVGRLAEAYDMPGQITTDWEEAIKEVSECRRVAIFNVVTFGFNSTLRKFEIVDTSDTGITYEASKDLVRRGLLPVCASKKTAIGANPAATVTKYCKRSKKIVPREYIRAYRDDILGKELKDFEIVVDVITRSWPNTKKSSGSVVENKEKERNNKEKGRSDNKTAPKLLIVHIVNMADCWLDSSLNKDLELGESWSAAARAVKDYYLGGKFGQQHQRLREAFREGDVAISVLPASFQFGETKHGVDDELVIFDSVDELRAQLEAEMKDIDELSEKKVAMPVGAESIDFDTFSEKKVAMQAELGKMTVKTLRALRKELYRDYKSNWSATTIGHRYKAEKRRGFFETDIYDLMVG